MPQINTGHRTIPIKSLAYGLASSASILTLVLVMQAPLPPLDKTPEDPLLADIQKDLQALSQAIAKAGAAQTPATYEQDLTEFKSLFQNSGQSSEYDVETFTSLTQRYENAPLPDLQALRLSHDAFDSDTPRGAIHSPLQ